MKVGLFAIVKRKRKESPNEPFFRGSGATEESHEYSLLYLRLCALRKDLDNGDSSCRELVWNEREKLFI